MLTPSGEDKVYGSVLADGKIHVTVPEGTEGAVVRKYKTSDGLEGEKTELVYKDIVGYIAGIQFRDGDYGSQIQITITDGDEKPFVLSLSTSSNYGEDIMKKLINVDLQKKVKIAPYSFTDEKGKKKRGITIFQNNGTENVKITNYFYDEKKKVNIHGYPTPKKTKKPLTKDQWKLYFAECREFLIEKITEHFKIETASATSADLDTELDDLVEEAAGKLD